MRFPYKKLPAITEDTPEGFYTIDHDAYHNSHGISSSAVKRALKGYAHYMAPTQKDTDALRFGRAFHAALLEPLVYQRDYTVEPKFDGHKNSNAYKAAYSAWASAQGGKEIISLEEAAQISGMKEAIRKHGHCNFDGFQAEIAAVKRCSDTGLVLKCKADLFGPEIIDIKTTSGDISPEEFLHTVVKYDYHVSAAFYHDIIEHNYGESLPFKFVAVSTRAPYDCEVHYITDEALDLGRQLYKAALKRIARWHVSSPDDAFSSTKRVHYLQPSPRMIYNAQARLEYIQHGEG